MTEDEMVGWHHRLDGHEFEQASGVGDGQGSLACCGPCDPMERVTHDLATEQQHWWIRQLEELHNVFVHNLRKAAEHHLMSSLWV